ncbi:hypothetical protein DFJ73DRAFT_830705 [Zopfochytrium polystomum]|nr:hypothetical protein DFJ73DRAFT_830705 [Zopfochytrium polystomum]
MGRKIEVPLRNGEEVLEVDVDDLGNNNENDAIISILADESVPFRLYLEFAREFYAIGVYNDFERVLKAAANIGAAGGIQARDPDYIRILSMLAMFYVEVATEKLVSPVSWTPLDDRDAKTLLQEATELINRCDAINGRYIWAVIAKGNLLLSSDRLEDAYKQYQFALDTDSWCVPAILGMASISSRRADYKAALAWYQKVLTLLPDIRPDVRVPIGICYHKLGMLAEARHAFKRALQLNDRNDDAILCLAIMDWNEARSQGDSEKLRQAAELVNRAYTINQNNPVMWMLMAERFFANKSYDKAERASRKTLEMTNTKELQAESYAIIGRAHHAKGEWAEAKECYSKAVAMGSSPPFNYGLGEIYLANREFSKAVECFEKVLAQEPDNFEALQKLAFICSQKEATRPRAQELYNRLRGLFRSPEVTEADLQEGLIPDPDIQMEMSKLYETMNTKIAREGYLNALKQYEEGSASVSAELLNNIGALYHREMQTLGGSSRDEALKFYERALLACRDSEFGDVPLEVTIRYNMARLDEQSGALDKAQEAYRSILDAHPSYLDAIARLGFMLMSKGKFEEARLEFAKLQDIDKKTHFLLNGLCFMEDTTNKGHMRDSRKAFEEVLQKFDKNDCFALCSIGNIYLMLGQNDVKNKESLVKKALEFFDKALRSDGRNVYAATGVGICLAELGKYSEAKEVFTQVQEGTMAMPTISINLAHVLVEIGQHRPALTFYERALKKLDNNVYVLLCLARAYYIIAKTERDPDMMLKTLSFIQKALRIEPSKLSLLYNVALVKQQYVQVLNDQAADRRDPTTLRKAVRGLTSCQRIFDYLGSKTDVRHPGFDIKHAQERAKFCKDVQRMAEKKLHETEEKRRLESERAEKERLQREKEQRERDMVERKRREIMELVQMKNKESREMDEREQQELREQKESRKTAKRSRDAESSDGEAGSGGEKDEKKRKSKKLVRKKAATADSSGEGDTDRATHGRASNLSKAIVDSDED